MAPDSLVVQSRFGDYQVQFCNEFTNALGESSDDHFFVVDQTVLDLYASSINAIAAPSRRLVVEATERQKSFDRCQDLLTELLERGVSRQHTLTAIGGGVIQDITGFAATILFRGMEWKFVPTTLLAQADSCIGGKTSINVGNHKNLLGSFHPPKQVIIDSGFLNTLPKDQIRSGVGEIMHFYLVAGSDRAAGLSGGLAEFLDDPEKLRPEIRASLEIKKEVIERDELDRGERRLFNYGHTFGHAVESISDYSVNHGQAVTLGMDIANRLSVRLGMLDLATFDRLHELLRPNLPAYRVGDEQLDAYLMALSKDKKNRPGHVGCILTRGPGRMDEVQIPMDDEFTTHLEACLSDLGEVVSAAS